MQLTKVMVYSLFPTWNQSWECMKVIFWDPHSMEQMCSRGSVGWCYPSVG